VLKTLLIAGVIASTPTAGLHRTTLVHASPRGRLVGAITATQRSTGEPTVLPIISSRRGWLRVRTPYRPDGSTGWISAKRVSIAYTPWALYVNRKHFVVRIFKNGKLQHRYPIIDGAPATPTPVGNFFITEIMEERGEVSGPYALLTSAYSNVLQEFDGGPGQVALHGREGLTGAISTASSHGCIRFEPDAITWMAMHLLQGTPIIIR
jgi:hypothetical protein